MVSATTRDISLTCVRCSYRWIPRKDELPKRCPKCRSTKWDDAHLCVNCVRCGYSWNSHDGNPKRCPKCGSHRWNIPPNNYTCKRCGRTWESRSGKVSKACPSCHSHLWSVSREPEEIVDSPNFAIYEKDILSLYRQGKGCVDIAVCLNVPYSTVREIVSREYRGSKIRT